MVESSYMAEQQSLVSILQKRRQTICFTQQPIQPLSTFTQGSQIQLVFQNSRNFLDLSKVQLFFRPVIQFDVENGLTAEQRAMLNITPVDAQSMFTLQSIQINGSQIISQPQSNLSVTRSIFQSYWGQLVSANSEKYQHLAGIGDVDSGLTFSGGSGSSLYGLIENSVLQPANGMFVKAGYDATALVPYQINPAQKNANSSLFERSQYPRAIVSQMQNYYPFFNTPHDDGNPALFVDFGCAYYGQQITTNADSVVVRAFPAQSSLLTFPMLAQAITPSVAIYKRQQEGFQRTRMRFIQMTVSSFGMPNDIAAAITKTLTIGQYTGSTTSAANGYNWTGDPNAVPPLQPTQITNNAVNATHDNLIGVFQEVKQAYGISVQNYGLNQSTSKYTGQQWSAQNSNLYNPEIFTQMSVALGDLSCELKDIGLICMENAQVVIQLQVNIPTLCLSAYLPPGLQADPYNSYTSPDGSVAPTCYRQFMQACLIGNTTSLTITDTTLRIEYTHFEDDSYPTMKALMMKPKPYTSIRQQYDVIPNASIFTQRLSIGSSSIIQCLFVMFIPANRGKLITAAQVTRGGVLNNVILPQDTCINYQGCTPVTDLRSTYMDSYYQELAQIYAEVDGQRFASMDLNLSSPQLSTYLVTQAGLQTSLGKFLNVSLQDYVQNRFLYVIPINTAGNPAMRIQDQQIVITANISNQSRKRIAETFNEYSQDINGQFGMLTFAVTLQSLVDCSYVSV